MGTYQNEIAIVIPALNPDERMVTLVSDLKEHGFENIIIVDDGSEIKTGFILRPAKKNTTAGSSVMSSISARESR